MTRILNAQIVQRAGGSLAVKALPALYGIGLVLLVVRAIPASDFGQYGIAIAYMNIASGLSRGLWTVPLVIHAAKGEREHLLAPSFWLSMGTAVIGGAIALVLLPLFSNMELSDTALIVPTAPDHSVIFDC